MDNTTRREQILQILHESTGAVTGTALAKACNVKSTDHRRRRRPAACPGGRHHFDARAIS